MKSIIYLFIYVSITVAAGMFGGLGNFFITHLSDPIVSNLSIPELWHQGYLSSSVVLGVIAAFVIPLFLKMISSNIFETNENNINNFNLMIYCGYCLLASLFSTQFLNLAFQKAIKDATRANNSEIQNNVIDSLQKNDYRLTQQLKQEVKNELRQELKNELKQGNASPLMSIPPKNDDRTKRSAW